MKIYKAYKFRMYPNDAQMSKLNSYLGTSRFIYNHYLSIKENLYKLEKKNISLSDMKKDLVNLQTEYPWLKEVDSCILRTSLDDLDNAYTRFFKGQGGYPKYKKKNHRDSYRTVCIRSSYGKKEYANIKIDLEKGIIKLPKIEEIRIRGYRNLKEFPGKILNATVSKEAGRYYVSVCVEEEIIEVKYIPRYFIGLDLGVKTLVTCSDGIKYERYRKIRVQEKRIKGLQRKLVRSAKDSKNRGKIIEKIERAYQKIRNMRKYYLHSITTKIVKENDVITCETLDVKGMIENKSTHLAKYLNDASMHEIIRQLIYKTKWNNKLFYQVNEYYPSSQLCSHCEYKNEEVKDLSIREWECNSCGYINDRDINASINIMNKGIEMYFKEIYSN